MVSCNELDFLGSLSKDNKFIPLASETVRAGNPIETNAFIEQFISLSEHLSLDPVTTYFFRSAVTIKKMGIFDNDILIVDRKLNIKRDAIVIAYHTIDEVSLRKVVYYQDQVFLTSPNLPVIEYSDHQQIWGVVRFNVHSFKRNK
ncbi:LexA family protein [Entomomonas asaccharolytica]|uniref:Peptidase S24/S26A/S26B/S26C domain-containing protein n=1 Tax=Entomomonas asaccharolytica TaxID=2785331 RepID=A0A974RZD2_9GAMM|nr:S24 family peptidase [Entomomonas asaccharolytica]QQP86959.1 hypothetical protein JHT90_06855 [Entomomonas asaccharolytica]